ncbi:flavin-containing monooxygenase [Chitinophaga nivalis]|uniref:NAD(P)-binding domain-containing protein n=1 Tax=Chitinophaga nivalis TaxID=2991709 RepID=A0ABT3II94_9BACT|nr:NAD(P)-binding domain-containing protein [Chitinophaga nivalis]MCW3466652.1 NAD(P)-binding domain-containing protein [Chitinophaga nivalis]MCW3483657.1 NAD(P)-binding domain-containing protein [Chitinophaga nivalis]
MLHVGIVGAGISGLVTAKVCLQYHYRVTLLEKAADIGGVWQPDRRYFSVSTQTPGNQYAFSDFPMPDDYPDWPSGEQIFSYVTAYADHFQLRPHIRFNTTVMATRYTANTWQADVHDAGNQTDTTLHFDFLIICTGAFHAPHIPVFPGMQSFIDQGGQIRHSTEINTAAMLEHKSVAVVGFAKSAMDIATLAADVAKDCTLIYRQVRWAMPLFLFGKFNLKYLFLSRFGEVFVDRPYSKGLRQLAATIKKPFAWCQWRLIEWVLKTQFNLKGCNMIPADPIEEQQNCSLGIAPPDFYAKVRNGQITGIHTEIARFEGRTVCLQNGTSITPDIVIFGTGFHRQLPFLEAKYQQLLWGEEKIYHLYRNILHPDIPQLAFVGFNTSYFTPLTSELAANWIARYIQGTLILPPVADIQKETERMVTWQKNRSHVTSTQDGTCIAPLNITHLDQLMRDMGVSRKVNGTPWRIFRPIYPKDYHALLHRKEK